MPIVIVSKTLTKIFSIVISVYAITIFPFIILSEEVDDYTMNHELIHFEQQKELFVDNEWEINLILPLSTIKYELVNQLNNERKRKQKPIK